MESHNEGVMSFLMKFAQSSEARVILSLLLPPLYVSVIPESIKFTTKNTTVSMLAMSAMLASLGKDYIDSTKYVIFTIIVTSVILAKPPMNKATEPEDVEADIRVPTELYEDLSDALRGNVRGNASGQNAGAGRKRNSRYKIAHNELHR